MKRYIICLAAALGLTAAARTDSAGAPTDSILSLERCTEMALRNNAAMRTASGSAEAAAQTRKEAFTKYFPQVSAQGMAFRTKGYLFSYDILHLIEIDLIKKGMAAGIQALQPIFLGGEIVNGNKLARVGEIVAELRSRQTEREVRLTTARYYWKLATLKATRSTLLSAITMLDTLSRQVKVAVDAGLVLNNDLLRVDLKRNDFRSQLVDLDNGIHLMRMLLSQYVGVDPDCPLDIDAEVPREMPPFPSDIYVHPADALYSTVDYSLLEQNVRAKDLERRMELGKYLPDVVAGAGWYYHNLLSQGHGYWAFMIGVNVPISGWWGGSHALKRKKIELNNARIELADKSQLLQIEMANRWDDLTSAHRKMEIAREAIGQSVENLRINRICYDAGTVAIADLLEAETLNKEANDRYAAAYGEFRTATAAYLASTAREP